MLTSLASMVIAALPAWLWGGRPLDLVALAQWRAREAPGGFRVQAQEAYTRRARPFLVDHDVVVDETGQRQAGYRTVSELADPGIEQPIFARLKSQGRLDLGEDKDLPSLLYHACLVVGTADGEDLAQECADACEAVRARVTSERGSPVFPQASVHVVRRSAALIHRVKLVSVLVRLQHDEQLAGGDVSQVLLDWENRRSSFGSSGGLADGVYVLDAYVAPLLAALSPAVWAVPAVRMHGMVLLSLGRPVSGTARVPNELLRSLTTVGAESGMSFGPFGSPDAPGSAVSWWAGRLDEMFAVLTDPEAFANADDRFEPTLALQNLLSVEQVFRRLNSILLAHHDTHARRPAFFTVIDTLMTLNGLSLDTMFSHTVASNVLSRLEARVPRPAQDVLLPAARRGVAALRQVQDGFFMREPDGRVRLRRDDEPVDVMRAAAKYVDMLRDATHGFTTVRGGAAQREEVATMVAVHDGAIPHDLGLLAWLYLLDLLDNPSRLRRIMSHATRRLRAR